MNRKMQQAVLASAAALALASMPAYGANANWNIDNAGNWSVAGNWSPATVPGTVAGDVVGLTNNITNNRIVTIDTTSRTVGTLNIGDSNNTHAFTLASSGGATLTFDNSAGGASIVESGSVADVVSAGIILNDNLALTAGGELQMRGAVNLNGFNLSANGSGLANFGTATTGVISGNGNITLTSGRLNLGAGQAPVHTYTGATNINGGVLMFAGNYSANSNININGGILESYWSTNITQALGSTAGTLRITGGESGFSLNGNTAFNVNLGGAGTTIQWGSANFAPSKFVLQSQYSQGTSSLTFQNGLNLDGANRTIVVNSGVAGTASATISGVISNGAGTAGIVKEGAGQLILTNTNTYNGTTAVSAGILTAATTTSLPGWGSAGNVSVASGATLGVRTSGTGAWTAANIDTLRANVSWASTTSALGIDVNSGTFSYASDVSDALSIRKYGTGTLNLNGDLSALGGSIILSAGTLSRSSGVLTAPSLVVDGGPNTVTISGTPDWTSSVTVNSGLVSVPAGTYAGFGTAPVTINGGGFSFGSGSPAITFANDMAWNAPVTLNRATSGTPVVTFDGDIVLGGNSGYNNNATTLSHALIFNGDISETGGSRSFTASVGTVAGNSVTFNGQNTFTGNITASTNGPVIIGGSGYLGGGSYAGTINIGTGTLTHSSSADQVLSGPITVGALTKNTSAISTLTLTGATNNYSGITTVAAGTLQLGKQTSLYNNTAASWTAAKINVNSGATLAFNVGGTGEFTSGNLTTLFTNLANSTSATNGMNAGSNFGFDTTNASGGSFTISQVVADSGGASGGARGLTKLGSGTLVLTNSNTYSGATSVNAGTLQVDGSLANSDVTIASTGTLGGSGSVKSVAGAGLVSPGASPGILTSGQADPAGGTDFAFEFTAVGGPDYANASASINDVLRLTNATTPFASALDGDNTVSVYLNVTSLSDGDVFIGGFYTDKNADFLSSVSAANIAYYVKGDGLGTTVFNGQAYYTLAAFSNSTSISLATVDPAGTQFGSVDGYVTQFTVVVPEPTSLTLLGLGGLAMLRRRRVA